MSDKEKRNMDKPFRIVPLSRIPPPESVRRSQFLEFLNHPYFDRIYLEAMVQLWDIFLRKLDETPAIVSHRFSRVGSHDD